MNENEKEELRRLSAVFFANVEKRKNEIGLGWGDLEKLAGLGNHVLSTAKTKGSLPGILAVVKVADLLDSSLDELLGRREARLSAEYRRFLLDFSDDVKKILEKEGGSSV